MCFCAICLPFLLPWLGVLEQNTQGKLSGQDKAQEILTLKSEASYQLRRRNPRTIIVFHEDCQYRSNTPGTVSSRYQFDIS